jgi:hypothetical protein
MAQAGEEVTPLGGARPGAAAAAGGNTVILEIDGFRVREDNQVDLGEGLRVASSHLVQRRQVGDALGVVLLRHGEVRRETLSLRPEPSIVGLGSFTTGPSYRAYAGLVFQPLTLRYLDAFQDAPLALLSYWLDAISSDASSSASVPVRRDREEVVILSGLLANELIRGYEEFEDQVVESVNGVPVRSLRHLSGLIDQASTGLLVIEFEGGGFVTLDREQAEGEAEEILALYGVPRDRSSDLAGLPIAAR